MSSPHNSVDIPSNDSHFRRNSKEYAVHIEDPENKPRVLDNSATVLEHPIEHYTRFPNRWTRIRARIREPLAEFFGTMILIIFGLSTNVQVNASAFPQVASSEKGVYLSSCFGWAAATALGVWVSGGVSGGHINPAVTLAFAVWRDFPWRKVPIYIGSQFLGAFVAAGFVYANYIHAIDAVEGSRHIRTVPPQTPGTAGWFSTYAASFMSNGSCIFDEFLGTMVLLMCLCALTDTRNGPPPPGLTGFAINPARDFGPRNESLINRPNATARAARLHAMNTETRKPPGGTAVDP
ncbi:hypothetical protein EIP91_010227 [Steccherinum ochraceum]|uniref:Aquaporin n=1 Tax=Steccherinum ochraceum TaxID=92696 RepID=A0A4R0R0U9_9APHY|nr:hypothetical protein EIP91_010227 [Steccherinum ochraceum]